MVSRYDPSGMLPVQRRYIRELNKYFKQLQRELTLHIYIEDTYGLLENTGINKPTVNVFKFATNEGKLKAFQKWLTDQVEQGLLLVDDAVENLWASKYINSAYRQAIVNSYNQVRKQNPQFKGQFAAGARAEFLSNVFNVGVAQERIKLLFMRNFEALKGITQNMSRAMGGILAKGLADGTNPRPLARELAKQLEIDRKRALRVARTEIMHSYAEGQLDTFQELGINKLDILAEWLTLRDSCQLCQDAASRTYTVAEARGRIPLHPNCRCSWAPIVDIKGKKLGHMSKRASKTAAKMKQQQASNKVK